MSKISDKQKQQVIELRKQGLGYRQIANKIDGLSQSNVGGFIRTKWFAEKYPDLVKIDTVKAMKVPKSYGETKCEHCGSNFIKKSAQHKYCNAKCRHAYRLKSRPKPKEQTKVCKGCATKFTTTVSRQIYCTDRCRTDYLNGLARVNPTSCEVCGRGLPKHANKFCSDECFNIHRKEYLEKRRFERKCEGCGAEFKTNNEGQQYCSKDCYFDSIRLYPPSLCEYCGKEFRSKKGRANKFCSRECFRKQTGAAEWKVKRGLRNITHIRRAKALGLQYEVINIEKEFDKYNWVCGICGKPVDKFLPYPNPESASIDHIKPMSKGGDHTKDNIQLAHLKCNLAKGNKHKAQ